MFSRVSTQQFTRCSFCSGVRIFGTTLAHLFHAQIVVQNLTLSLLMLVSSEIARMLSRRSPRKILATFSTFSWVFTVEGRPDFGSSPTYSLPSLNFLNHSKTCVRDKTLITIHFCQQTVSLCGRFSKFCEEFDVNTLFYISTQHYSDGAQTHDPLLTMVTARLTDARE